MDPILDSPIETPQDQEQPEVLPVWHHPIVTPIEIKRTMNGSGGFSDGSGRPSNV